MYQLLLITPFPAISSKSERYRVTSNWIYKRGIWLHSAVVGEVNGMQFDQAGRVVPDYPIRYFNWIITGKRDSLLKIIDSQIEYFKNCNYMSKMMNFDALKEATVKGIVRFDYDEDENPTEDERLEHERIAQKNLEEQKEELRRMGFTEVDKNEEHDVFYF